MVGKSYKVCAKGDKKGLNSLIILVAWEVWKHRNTCVFYNARPWTSNQLRNVLDECGLWGMARASKLQELLASLLTTAVKARVLSGRGLVCFVAHL